MFDKCDNEFGQRSPDSRAHILGGTERGLFRFALWMFFETVAAIFREDETSIMGCSVKRGSTVFLKILISLVAIAALAGCIGLPGIVESWVRKQPGKRPETAYLPYLWLACAYILSIPFFVGLYQAFKLLNYIQWNRAFSEPSAGALRRLKYSAITISALMVAGIGTLMALARGKGEDIAGIVALGLLITLASSVVAIVAAVFQRRVQKALGMRLEPAI